MIVNVRYYLVVETPSARWNESKAQSVGTSMYTEIRNVLSKRDLKGFKCMTVRLDVFGDIPRLFQYFVNVSNILWMIPIFWEKFNYFVNHFNMLWVIPSYCELLQYIVNHSHILWIFPMFGESFQCIVNYSNILWIIPIFCEFIKWLNCS